MADVAKAYQNELPTLKKNVETSHAYWRPNIMLYHDIRTLVFKTSISDTDRAFLDVNNRPILEFNVLESLVSRLRGEFSKQVPSIVVRPISDNAPNDDTVKVVEGYMRSILFDANNDQFENEVYKDTLSGGFSVIKVWTEYENEHSFNQNIHIGRVFDPTLCGFDPMANTCHKGDGKYCYELYPMTKEDFKVKYPSVKINTINYARQMGGFSWYYNNNADDILLICDYYKKKERNEKIVMLADGQTMTEKKYQVELEKWVASGNIMQAPKVVKERKTKVTYICRYTFIGDKVLSYEETDFSYLPLIFVDGNSIQLRNNENDNVRQMTRPYVYHAIDAQRMKNFAGQTFVNEIQTMVQHKFMAPEEAIPENADRLEAWINPQKASTLLYRIRDPQGRDIPPPTAIVRPPMPREIVEAFLSSDSTIQNILGTFDAQAMNKRDLSGKAIVEGATQNNAAAMPYLFNYMASLNQAAQVILDLIPKYLVTPRTIPYTDMEGKKTFRAINQQDMMGQPVPGSIQMTYEKNALEVKVQAGVNFEIQKQRALETMEAMAQAVPSFAQILNGPGLPILVSNIDIRGADQLKQLADQFVQQQQQNAQNQPPPPEIIAAQLKQQEMQQKMQVAQMQAQMDAQKNQFEALLQQKDLQLKADELEIKRVNLLMEEERAKAEQANERLKTVAEIQRTDAEFGLKQRDQEHRHSLEIAQHHHQVQQAKVNNAKESQNQRA